MKHTMKRMLALALALMLALPVFALGEEDVLSEGVEAAVEEQGELSLGSAPLGEGGLLAEGPGDGGEESPEAPEQTPEAPEQSPAATEQRVEVEGAAFEL